MRPRGRTVGDGPVQVTAMTFPRLRGLTHVRRNLGGRSDRDEQSRATHIRASPWRRSGRLDDHVRADARHGRGPGDRSGRPRLVPRDLGDDDRRDDAADGLAARGVDCPARAHPPVRGRVSRRLDSVRPRGLRRLSPRHLVRHRLARLERGRAVCRRRCHRGRGPLRAHAVQAAQPAPLPHVPRRRRRAPERARARPRLRRLLGRAHARALRGRRDEPVLDGGGCGGDLRREGPPAGPAAVAGARAGTRRPRPLGRDGAGERPRAHRAGPNAADGDAVVTRRGTREEWLAARVELLEREKELTRKSDELARQRAELPWVPVEKEYRFETEAGWKTLAELFDGRSQLLVYHFMFGPTVEGWPEVGCPGCSFTADSLDGPVVHLPHRGVTFVAVSRAPLDRLKAYRARMGWSFPWVSYDGSDFNLDFGAFTEEE